MLPEDKLKKIGIELPQVPKPLGSYVPCVRSGNFLFISGMLPLKHGKLSRTGKVGSDLSLAESVEATRIATINALSVVKSAVGSLNNVARCIKITGYIASSPGFTEQPQVLNGASDLIFEVFGQSGRHARVAVGVPVLPMDSPVEIEFVFEVSG